MMNKIIKERLALIQSGTIPHGYKKTKAGIMPEDWDGAVRAKDVFKNHTDKKHNGDLEILAATQENGIVPRSQIGIDIQCSEEGVNGYKKVSKGDFVISLRSFQGGIEYSEYDGIVSPSYTVLQPIREISDGYYRNYFKTDSFIQRLNGSVYGIRDGKQIGYQDFGDMYIHCPPIDEQKKIAEVLSCCDRVIELKQQLIAELQRLKSGFFQAMFPAKGHSEPDIRFPEFSDDWEQRKFEEIAVRSSVICSDANLPRVEYEDIVSGAGRLNKDIYAKQSSKSGIAFHQGDVLYGKLRPYLQNWLLPTFDGLAVGDFWVLQPQNADSSFLYRLIQSRQFDEVANQSTGTKMPRADWKLVSKTVFSIPSNISEQATIGTYFTALDHLITLHQRELEETKKKKKSLAKLLLTGSVRVPT